MLFAAFNALALDVLPATFITSIAVVFAQEALPSYPRTEHAQTASIRFGAIAC